MRIITGKAKGCQLKTPKGMSTRPTSDRVKESLFSILGNEVEDVNVLDVFAGTGGLGLEALSRGASEAVLVENYKEAQACIRENIKATGMQDYARLMAMDVMQALRRLNELNQPFDIIFMDPPYRKDIEVDVIYYLLESSIVKEGTIIIVETSMDTDVSYMNDLPCTVERIKDYKTNRHVFLRV